MTIDEIVQKIYEERYVAPKSPETAAHLRDSMIREVVERALELYNRKVDGTTDAPPHYEDAGDYARDRMAANPRSFHQVDGGIRSVIQHEIAVAYREGYAAAPSIDQQRMAVMRSMIDIYNTGPRTEEQAKHALAAIGMALAHWPPASIKFVMESPSMTILTKDDEVSIIVAALDDSNAYPEQPKSIVARIYVPAGQALEWGAALSKLNLSPNSKVVPDLFDAAEAFGEQILATDSPPTGAMGASSAALLDAAVAYTKAKRGL